MILQKRNHESTENEETVKLSNNYCMAGFITFLSVLFIILTFPISIFVCIRIVREYERILVFRLGRLRFGKAIDFTLYNVQGMHCILTSDSVTVQVDAVLFYHIKDPASAILKVGDYASATQLLAATTLRNVLGMKNLSEILQNRDVISYTMQEIVDLATNEWGIKVEKIE
ncbi:hypothetical protein A3Q56_02806, partial [Intoshia linei]